MKIKKNNFLAKDKTKLIYRYHQNPKAKAVLICVHGVNEYSGRYLEFFEKFKDDFSIYIMDNRGHGESEGYRAHVDSFSNFVQDLETFVALVSQSNPNKKIFILGHSLGGQIVTNYLIAHPKNAFSGFILSSPNLKLTIKITWLKEFLARNLAKHFPKFRLPNELKPEWLSHDLNVVEQFVSDPLVSHSITAKLGVEIVDNLAILPSQYKKIQLPALLLHAGADKITHPDGTKDLYEKIKSKDKTLKIYPGFYHEIFNEIDRDIVFSDLQNWLEERI
jgi:acylglycerol lipase